jgi:UDP-glucose 4-epimerase
MKTLVTGGAGFLGSRLAERLLGRGDEVLVLDDLSAGKRENLEACAESGSFRLVETDLLEDGIGRHFRGIDAVFHLAANPDVRAGETDPETHLRQNTLVTHRVLEAARKQGVKRFVFASTSAVYGNARKVPTPEDCMGLPVSLYGASKLACESLVSAYSGTFGVEGVILRLANIIGPRSGHGVIFDFIAKLRKDPKELEILGDGNQDKSYLHVDDCIEAFLKLTGKGGEPLKVFNVGSSDRMKVVGIARMIAGSMGLEPELRFTGGPVGWKGDVRLMQLDIGRSMAAGWKPTMGSREAVERTVKGILAGER